MCRFLCYYHDFKPLCKHDIVLYKQMIYRVVGYKKGLVKIANETNLNKVYPSHITFLDRGVLDMDRFKNAMEKSKIAILNDSILFKEYRRISNLMYDTKNDFSLAVMQDALKLIEDRAIAKCYNP